MAKTYWIVKLKLNDSKFVFNTKGAAEFAFRNHPDRKVVKVQEVARKQRASKNG